MRPLGCYLRGKRGQQALFLQRETKIVCTWSLDISEKLHIYFVGDKTFGWLSSFLFHFLYTFFLLFYDISLYFAIFAVVG